MKWKIVIWVVSLRISSCIFHVKGELSIKPDTATIWEREGRPFDVTCVFRGSRDTHVSWKKDSLPLEASEDVSISLQTSVQKESYVVESTVSVQKVSDRHEGIYTCEAEEETKSVDVKIIKGRLKIFPKVGRILAFINDSATITCEYIGSEQLELQWRKDINSDVRDYRFTSKQRTVTGSEVTSILQISKTSIEPGDAGEYTCTAGPLSRSVILEAHKGPCRSSLLSDIDDDALSASSFYEDTLYSDGPSRARLNQEPEVLPGKDGEDVTFGGGWLAKTSNKSQWIQVQFAAQSVVRSIITQGRSSQDCCNQSYWVKKYKVEYSPDGVTWYRYKDQSGNLLFFRGNYDHDTPRTNPLQYPVIARALRLIPTEWNEKIAMRFDVEGCVIPQNIRMIYPNKSFQNLEVPKKLEITCEYTGPRKANVTWFKDGRPILYHYGFIHRVTESSINGRTSVTSGISKPTTEYADSGNYSCRIDNTTLGVSTTIYAVKLDRIPNYDRLWLLNDTAMQLSCAYKSRDKRDFSWRYEYQNTYIGKFGFDVNVESKTVSGAVELTSSITKDHVSQKDKGLYRCLTGGMSREWNVRVIIPIGNRSSQLLQVDDTMYLDCEVQGLSDDVKYERFWTKDRQRISQIDTRGRMHYFPDAKTLQITKAEMGDAGKYECNILLEVGTQQKQQVVIVKELRAPPNATLEGQKVISAGDSLHLFCKITGYPKPDIVWLKNGQPLTKMDSKVTLLPYDGVDNGHLVVFNVNENEAGKYVCKAVTDVFPPSVSSLEVEVKGLAVSQNSPVIVGVSVGGGIVLVLILLCGACMCCNKRRRHDHDYGHDTDSLEKLRKERPSVRYEEEKFQSGMKLVRLNAEPRLFPKKPEQSSIRMVSSAEEVDSTYEKVRLRGQCNTSDPNLNQVKCDVEMNRRKDSIDTLSDDDHVNSDGRHGDEAAAEEPLVDIK